MLQIKRTFWILCVLASATFLQWNTPVYAAETKEVCKGVIGKDGKPVVGKDGKPKQACKTIKVHKKLEGTEVPVKK
jgi:hypothetical protein